MKRIYSLLIVLAFIKGVSAQLTGTKNIPGDYVDLVSAITDLNAQGVGGGGVTLNLLAGNPQTTPAGGYVIGNTGNILVGATNPTVANPVIIEGNGNIITAFTPQTSGNLNDAIFKLIGADYITIQHFTMQENPANTTIAEATNNMTEWGMALLYVTATDGSKNNTIQNNTISLNRAYRNSFGVYSNVRHTAIAPTATADITNITGSNSGNKIYSNAISNVGYGIVFVGSSVAARMDSGNDIGGSSIATGNTISNWGGNATALSAYVSVVSNSYCIEANHQVNENISCNTITSAAVSGFTFAFGGILKAYTGGAPSGTISSVINSNTITLSSSNASGNMTAINSQDVVGLSTSTLTINSNSIINCVINGGGTSSTFNGISSSSAWGTLNMNNNIIRGNSSVAVTGGFTGFQNSGAVINAININSNQVGIAGSGAIIFSNATTGAINCINNTGAASTAGININNNSIDGISAVSTGQVTAINNSSNAEQTVNINNNQLGSVTGALITFIGVQSSQLLLISNENTLTFPNSTNNLFIQGNDFRGITHSVPGTADHYYIRSKLSFYQHITGNTFTNLVANTTGNITFIDRSGNLQYFNDVTVSNNSIVGAFAKTAAGGLVQFYTSTGTHEESIPFYVSGNDFSNVTVTGATAITGFSMTGFDHWEHCTGNSFNNITGGSADITMIYMTPNHDLTHGFLTHTCNGNTISNITGTGAITAINVASLDGPLNCSFNTISNLVSSGSGGDIKAIIANFGATVSVFNNGISGLSSSGASANVTGIQVSGAAATNIYENVVNNFSCSGAVAPLVNGIAVSGTSGSINIYRNKVYDLLQSGTVSTGSAIINGIVLSGGGSTVHNNFIADLKATNASLADAIRGISASSVTANRSYNLYYNSVYINAASTGTNFGSTGIYHLTNATATTGALNMIDNIIVNTSTANGTGVTTAYRRSDATLTNFTATSDNNLFYAGTPGAGNLIYFDGTNADQTLAAYQTRVNPREANSISLMPAFISNTDLHLTTANCGIDGRGKAVSVTIDIDNATRDATTPDMGADEFTATYGPALAGIVSTVVCDNKTVSAAGTNYGTSVCELIAKIVPSGGAPVAGKINACVTLDATQQYFNAEPYVQRHYDIEPAVSDQTTTSATISLYFTDAEFALYNAINPVWPALPTAAGGGNSDPNITNVKVTQFHGTPIGGLPTTTPGNYPGVRVLLAPVSVILTGSVWEVKVNVAGFSGFYVHSNLFNTPLPITVNYFNGIKQSGIHLLNWKVTCYSTPTVTMELERSTDGIIYNPIYSIAATALQCQQPFNYIDAHPVAGINYYRLKMTDANGKITYSSIVSLINASKGFDIMNIAPNPVVNGSLRLDISAAQKAQMEIVITDMQGRVMQRQSANLIAGFNTIPVNVTNLSTGTYQVHGFTADGRSRALRFVVQ